MVDGKLKTWQDSSGKIIIHNTIDPLSLCTLYCTFLIISSLLDSTGTSNPKEQIKTPETDCIRTLLFEPAQILIEIPNLIICDDKSIFSKECASDVYYQNSFNTHPPRPPI